MILPIGDSALGLPWMEDMFNTDENGYIHATGGVMGEHCILCRSVNVHKRYFILRNSWGRGFDGDCKISFSDMKKLLSNGGESVFFEGRHTVHI